MTWESNLPPLAAREHNPLSNGPPVRWQQMKLKAFDGSSHDFVKVAPAMARYSVASSVTLGCRDYAMLSSVWYGPWQKPASPEQSCSVSKCMKQNSGQFRTEHYFQCLQDLYWKLATGFVRQCECVAARGCCGINLTMVDCQILVGFWYCQKCLY